MIIPSQTSTADIGNESINSSHTLLGMWLDIHEAIQVSPVSERGQQYQIMVSHRWSLGMDK